jgi:hypothetical protein
MSKEKNIQKKSDKTLAKSSPKEKKATKAQKKSDKKNNDA